MVSREEEFSVPAQVDLLDFFGRDPIERNQGYWRYEVSDAQGVVLRLSVDIFERSVQVELLSGDTLLRVSHEGATRMAIENGELHCEFAGSDWTGTLTVVLGDKIRVDWSTLRVR